MERAVFVGPGRMGTALALALSGLQEVLGASGGSAQSREQFAAATGLSATADAAALCRQADWIYLTVPDRAVADAAQALAQAGAFHAGQVVCHTAGALDSTALGSAQAAGAQVLALHPMQAVAQPLLGRAAFAGAVCTVQGDDPAAQRAEKLVQALGMIPWRVPAERKPALHAAAALASNGLVGLLASAAEAAAGPEADAAERAKALAALLPLAEGTLRNVAALGIPQALTGPVERGDLATVRRHLEALYGDAAILYAALLPVLSRLAADKGAGPQDRDVSQLLAEVRDRWPGA